MMLNNNTLIHTMALQILSDVLSTSIYNDIIGIICEYARFSGVVNYTLENGNDSIIYVKELSDNRLLTHSHNLMKVWDLVTRSVKHTHPLSPDYVCTTTNTQFIAVLAEHITVFDHNLNIITSLNNTPCAQTKFLWMNEHFLVTTSGYVVSIWDINFTLHLIHLPDMEEIWTMAFISSNQAVFGGKTGSLYVCNLSTSTIEHTFTHAMEITSIVALLVKDPGQIHFATASRDRSTAIWSLTGMEAMLAGDEWGNYNLTSLHSSQTILLSTTDNDEIYIWDFTNKQCRVVGLQTYADLILATSYYADVTFSNAVLYNIDGVQALPDGQFITWSRHGHFAIWSFDNLLHYTEIDSLIISVDITRDNMMIMGCSDGKIIVWV